MNRFQKIALQCAKDDKKKGYYLFKIKEGKRDYLYTFKKEKYTIEKARDFKNWNKDMEW